MSRVGRDVVAALQDSTADEWVVITDRCRPGWEPFIESPVPDGTSRSARVTVVDVGEVVEADDAIVDVRPVERGLYAGRESQWIVTLRDAPNRQTARKCEVECGSHRVIVDLPVDRSAGQYQVSFALPGLPAGHHVVSVSREADHFEPNDLRRVPIVVREELNVWLVTDGVEQHDVGSELPLVRLALQVGLPAQLPLRITERTKAQWEEDAAHDVEGARDGESLPRPAVAVFADVSELSELGYQTLERWVRQGMGLMVFFGDRAAPAAYHRQWHSAERAMMPLRLGRFDHVAREGLTLGTDLSDSTLRIWTELQTQAFNNVATERVHRLEVAGDCNVLLRWSGPSRPVAVAESTWGRGTIIWWNLSASSNVASTFTHPTQVVGLCEAVKELAAVSLPIRESVAGMPWYVEWPVESSEETGRLVTPDGTDVLIDRRSGGAVAPSDREVTNVERRYALRRGWYRWYPTDRQSGVDHVVHPDLRESDLRRVTDDQIARWFGSERPRFITWDQVEFERATFSNWKVLLTLVMLVLVGESGWAAFLGRGR